VGSHESQGFAVQEALASNVPLIVLDADCIADEINQRHRIDVAATTVPYWDSRCGIKLTKPYDDVTNAIHQMKKEYGTYKPREFILDTLSPQACMKRWNLWFSGRHQHVFIVTSVLNVSEAPLSYTRTRSVYTADERLAQTLRTIESIRQKMPKATIVVVEGSVLSSTQYKSLQEAADVVLLSPNQKEINGLYKGFGESKLLLCALDYITTYTSAEYVWKLSGRYRLTQDFSVEKWNNRQSQGKMTDGVMNTILFRVWNRNLTKFRTFLTQPESVWREKSIEQLARDSGLFVPIEGKIGVQGNIAVDGYFIDL
jgi:hypothetical protein